MHSGRNQVLRGKKFANYRRLILLIENVFETCPAPLQP